MNVQSDIRSCSKSLNSEDQTTVQEVVAYVDSTGNGGGAWLEHSGTFIHGSFKLCQQLRKVVSDGRTLNSLKPSGYYICHLLYRTEILHSVHKICLCLVWF
jgi:hypothetical protein